MELLFVAIPDNEDDIPFCGAETVELSDTFYVYKGLSGKFETLLFTTTGSTVTESLF